ncbi:MFS transporter [Streptomyces albus subsp. chlorinus]|nr:MFS transporter [Streptomyces albus]NSC24996.1 MFS transporter [Streptomyces albus subsp. chlorinus]
MEEPPRAGRAQWAALAVVLLGAFMGFLDIFVVNVANPAIQRELNASFAEIGLVPAGYTLAYAVGLVTGGRLGDLYGRRRIFLSGVAAFAATSLLCACATTPAFLIGARVAQGLAAALMLPQVLALLQATFRREEERARALGLYGAVVGAGVVAGQVVGGLLLAWDVAGLGWRAVFLVNVPLCAATFAGALVLVGEADREGARPALDLAGAALLGAGLFGLLHPLVVGGEGGWTAPLVVETCAAAVLLGLFVLWERRVARAGGAPLLPPRLFAQRGFSLGLPTALLFYGSNGAFVFLLAFHLQQALSFSPWQSAALFTPMALCTSVAAIVCGKLVARWGGRVVPWGALVTGAGLLAVWATTATQEAAPGRALLLLPGLVLYGLGGGVVATSLLGLALAEVAPQDAGAASGGLLTAVQASEAAGVAGIGALFSAISASTGPTDAFAAVVLLLAGLAAALAFLLHRLRRD